MLLLHKAGTHLNSVTPMRIIAGFVFLLLSSSCAVSKTFNTNHKYAPKELQEDYEVFQNLLEEEHPGLYWYTPKETIDQYFEWGKERLQDSLTETEFRKVLSYITSHVNCGHTTIRPSRKFLRSRDSLRNRMFPLNIKFWQDTALVTSSLNRRDSLVKRGSIIKSIDGRPISIIRDSLFKFLSSDGYNLTHKYQSLSNRGVFSNLYLTVYGYKDKFTIQYQDTSGKLYEAVIPIFTPRRDSAVPIGTIAEPRRELTKRERKKIALENARSLRIDTAQRLAIMELNTFTKKFSLPEFYSKSFKTIRKKNIEHLVIDLRGNGGGSVTNSNLLTKYLAEKRFKIADSIYALKRNSNYGMHQKHRFLHWLFLVFMTRKEGDGKYHFNMYEEKSFKPKQRNHFNGSVYILTGGNTFSAATLVAQALKKQDNVTIVGEETGGGGYGNNAWLIPDVTLPNTRVRFRLPLFRLVIDKNEVKGRGVMPEIEALPTVNEIIRNEDFKLKRVYQSISH